MSPTHHKWEVQERSWHVDGPEHFAPDTQRFCLRALCRV